MMTYNLGQTGPGLERFPWRRGAQCPARAGKQWVFLSPGRQVAGVLLCSRGRCLQGNPPEGSCCRISPFVSTAPFPERPDTISRGRCHSHLTWDEPGAQRGCDPCLRSHSENPRHSWPSSILPGGLVRAAGRAGLGAPWGADLGASLLAMTPTARCSPGSNRRLLVPPPSTCLKFSFSNDAITVAKPQPQVTVTTVMLTLTFAGHLRGAVCVQSSPHTWFPRILGPRHTLGSETGTPE